MVFILAIKRKQRGLRWGRRLEETGERKAAGSRVKM